MKLFEIHDQDEDVWNTADIQQEYPSDKTSLNQIPATFKKIDSKGGWKEGTINLDIGGGREFVENGQSIHKFSNALKAKGVTNLVYDPFNRSFEHNSQVAEQVKKNGADTVTVNNVLNVIPEEQNRMRVIKQAYAALKPGHYAYFYIYQGNKSGEGKDTGRGKWQNNMKADDYVPEISKFFSNVKRSGQLIVAEK